MGERDGEEKAKIGGQPIGLTKGGKDPGLDILDPDVFVDTKMLGDTKGSDGKTGQEGASQQIF